MKTVKNTITRFKPSQRNAAIFVLAFALIGGIVLLLATHAAGPFVASEPEGGTLSGAASIIGDATASGGQALRLGSGSTGSTKCGLTNVAFCDTFNAPAPAGERSGDLSSVWGASRVRGGGFNAGQNQDDNWIANMYIDGSCPHILVTPATYADNDIRICNGQLNETVNDNPSLDINNPNVQNDGGDVTALTMYPKQPFDFGGRIGKVVFDVGDDSAGMHSAWPEFWMTDKPVPNPFNHFGSWQSIPQNGFGIRLGQACGAVGQGSGSGGGNCAPNCPNTNTTPVVTVNDAATINNFVNNDPDNEVSPGTVVTTHDNCVKEPTQPGQLNHFEIDINDTNPNQPQIDVYGTDAGTTTPLKHLATITNLNLSTSFTKGLIWLEDVHYNGSKDLGLYVNGQHVFQGMHTFTWDNVGFDGPVLPRDLAFEVPDSLQLVPAYPTSKNLGWYAPTNTNITVTDPGVSGVAQATAGLLELNFKAFNNNPVNLTYSLNGHASHVFNWSQPGLSASLGSPVTRAIPIDLSEVVTGNNTIAIQSNDPTGLFLQNVSLVMVGAGGVVNP